MQILSAEYAKIVEQSNALLADERDLIANAANIAALLFEALEAVDWVGIYFLRNGELVLGPFQGHAVKSRLTLNRSNAGRAVHELRSIITQGRTAENADRPSLSQAQILVPLRLRDRCLGILEIDSPFTGRFNDNDRAGLEVVAQLLVEASDTTAASRRSTVTEFSQLVPEVIPPEAPPLVRAHVAPPAEPPLIPQPVRQAIPKNAKRRLLPALLVALTLLFAAVLTPRNTVSPDLNTNPVGEAAIHILVSMIGFTLLGTAIALGRRMHMRAIMLLTVVYAFVLTSVQSLTGAHKSILAHCADLIFGLLGGYLGAVIARALRRYRSRQRAVAVRRP